MNKTISILITLILALAVNAQNKPYITKVYDFVPAPGQYINELPYYDEIEHGPLTKETILSLVEADICGYTKANGAVVIANAFVSLGSFGGYIVFGFDHPVVNVKGELDFQVLGNAIQSTKRPDVPSGSSEPGIVMVSSDVNGNGEPDDPWYELAGSEYTHPKTQHNFSITYYRPDDSMFPPLGNGKYYDQYIRWTSNSVDSLRQGYIRKNSFHQQSYWPAWIEGDSITFVGTKLRGNAVNFTPNGNDWHQYFFDWGYVDNRPDWLYSYTNKAFQDNMNTGFNIDWAVDEDGNHVELKQIDFVKVYNGMLQDCGWLGETSTEVAGAFDLHPDAVPEPDPEAVAGDVNGDQVCNSADVTALYKFILSNDSSTIVNGDQNDDGTVNSADVTAVYKIILGEK